MEHGPSKSRTLEVVTSNYLHAGKVLIDTRKSSKLEYAARYRIPAPLFIGENMFEFIAGVALGAVFAPVWMAAFNGIKTIVSSKVPPIK